MLTQGLGQLQVSYIQYKNNTGPSNAAGVAAQIAATPSGQTFVPALWATFPSNQVPQWEVLNSDGTIFASGGSITKSSTPMGYGSQTVTSTGISAPTTPVDTAPVPSVTPPTNSTVSVLSSMGPTIGGTIPGTSASMPNTIFGIDSTTFLLGAGALLVGVMMMGGSGGRR